MTFMGFSFVTYVVGGLIIKKIGMWKCHTIHHFTNLKLFIVKSWPKMLWMHIAHMTKCKSSSLSGFQNKYTSSINFYFKMIDYNNMSYIWSSGSGPSGHHSFNYHGLLPALRVNLNLWQSPTNPNNYPKQIHNSLDICISCFPKFL